MGQIHPVQLLLDEHEVIEDVLVEFEARLRPSPEERFPVQWFRDALDFFRHFVEGCHHEREERLVFPQLRETGLFEQHDAGTPYLDRMDALMRSAERGETDAQEAFRYEGRAYIRFLREHIRRENELLHWAARLPSTEQQILRMQQEASPERFHNMPQDLYERYLALAETLCAAEVA